MSKQKPSSHKQIVKADASGEKPAPQSTEPVENIESAENTGPESSKLDNKVEKNKAEKQDQVQARPKAKPEQKPPMAKPDPEPKSKPDPKPKTNASPVFPLFGIFNLLLIIGIVAAAGYYWQMQQKVELEKNKTLAALQVQLANKTDASQLQQRLAPLQSNIDNSVSQIAELRLQQQALEEATVKLYELYGRDESGWQLAEVEYLMRIAQHKLILENDFAGAAITLQAASDKIGAIADPGLLPVRVQISEEIAILKTRARPDLVGMTLVLSQLGRQIKALTPGYLPRTESSQDKVAARPAPPTKQTITERVVSFIAAQVSVKKDESPPTRTEALVIDIEQTLEDNLKLTRWSVLERDNFQFKNLMEENLRLFKQYYNLDNAANYDFYSQLAELQKSTLKPEKPDISGSLELLKRIISKRENAPQQTESEGGENG